MAFTFGGGAQAGTPASGTGNSTGTGFTFGSTPAGGPSQGTSFGAPPPTAATTTGGTSTPQPGGGFSFGDNKTPSLPPVSGAPSTGGFQFGAAPSFPSNGTPTVDNIPGKASAPNGPTKPSGTNALASGGNKPTANTKTGDGTTPTAVSFGTAPSAPGTGGSSFGASTPVPTTLVPGVGGVSFGASTPRQPIPATGTGFGAQITQPTQDIAVPIFEEVFPRLKLYSKVRALASKVSRSGHDGNFAGEELVQHLRVGSGDFGDLLSNPPPLKWAPRNDSLRQRLQSNPMVKLYDKPAALTPNMIQEVFKLADELRISELDALALYSEASILETRQWLEKTLDSPFVMDSMKEGSALQPLVLGNDVVKAARELYFLERVSLVKTILFLAQKRLETEPNKFLLLATDQLLSANMVTNLVGFVRESTKLIIDLRLELKEPSPPAYSLAFSTPTRAKEVPFGQVLLRHLHRERQIAAESLFFLTYHTQCTADEVVALIDLVRDISNGIPDKDTGLPVLDPFNDVPDGYSRQEPTQSWQAPFTTALPPQKEKNSLEWERELVSSSWQTTGKPQLLECLSVLVVSVLCALSTRNVLMDRESHGPNHFGQGNALFMTDDGPPRDLLPIHDRLNPLTNAGKDWQRQDIWGVLAASYALLLRPLHAVLTSPRSGRSPSITSLQDSRIDVRSTWKACLMAPSQKKSFTFIRLTLMPAFRRHHLSADVIADSHEFLMSVMAEFTSIYLDILCAANLVPPSRFQWERTEEEDLRIRREEQEQEAQLMGFSGGAMMQMEPVPMSVDLLKRPDCVDDLIAVAVAICSEGGSYACHFWSVSEETVTDVDGKETEIMRRLAPSRAFKQLEILQESDRTLVPSHLSFLAGLALANTPDIERSGASTLNKLLGAEPSAEKVEPITWKSLLATLRWYVRALSPIYSEAAAKASPSSLHLVGEDVGSTSYYYDVDSVGFDGSAGFEPSSSKADGGKQISSVQLTELNEANTAILLAHLSVISNIASLLPEARETVLSTKLPVEDAETSSIQQDDVLLILFSLSIAPLAPDVRGAVFATISNLLRVDKANADEEKSIREMAFKAWDLLEESQVVPINLLDQYPNPELEQNNQRMVFPPSSTSMAGQGMPNSLLPVHPKFGMLYEFEHVESRVGQYPSTEGLLKLLASLVMTAGCPENIGELSGRPKRNRAGAVPYLEYVSDFVLRRILGTNRSGGMLPFKSPTDKSRLVAGALEVVDAILVQYPTPQLKGSSVSLKDHPASLSTATSILQLESLTERVVLPSRESDHSLHLRDFQQSTEQTLQISGGNTESLTGVPRAKSPGYTLLADILSATNGDVLSYLVTVLGLNGGSQGILKVSGVEEYKIISTFALFGDTPPTVASAKSKSHDGAPSILKQTLLSPLLPPFHMNSDNDLKSVVHWRERCVSLALRILCATAAREGAFREALSGTARIVPVITSRSNRTVKTMRQLQLSSLKDLLVWSPDNKLRCLPYVVEYIGYIASDPDTDAMIASAALALVIYASNELSSNDCLQVLGGLTTTGEWKIALSMAQRLLESGLRAESSLNADVVTVILDSLMKPGLSDILLGLNHDQGRVSETFAQDDPTTQPMDCLFSMLRLLGDFEFATNPKTSKFAARSFEIIYRILALQDRSKSISFFLERRLQSQSFWIDVALFFLGEQNETGISSLGSVSGLPLAERPEGIENFLSCIAWALRGMAQYFANQTILIESAAFSRHNQYLISLLLGQPCQLLRGALQSLPIRSDEIHVQLPQSLYQFREIVLSCREELLDPPEFAVGYYLVNKQKLKKGLNVSHSGECPRKLKHMLEWVDQYNAYVLWDCASRHLASSVLTLMETLFQFLDYFHDHSHSSLNLVGDSLSGARRRGPSVLLDAILGQLNDLGSHKERDGIASIDPLMVSTTQQLSVAVLTLVDRILRLSSAAEMSAAQHFLPPLAQATLTSCQTGMMDLQPLGPRAEQSIILGGALAKVFTHLEGDTTTESMHKLLSNVIVSFIKLCTASPDGKGSENTSRSEVKIMFEARCILSSLVSSDIDRADGTWLDRTQDPLSQSTSSKTPLESLINLVTTLDDQICSVLEKVACYHGGSEHLVKAGFLDAMTQACNKFMEEMDSGQNELHNTAQPFQWPTFLFSHISLLSTVLSSPTITQASKTEVASAALKIICLYSPVLERVVSSFPEHGDLWLEVVQCLALASGALESLPQNFGASGAGRESKVVGLVVMIMIHLLEYPFPQRLLPALPPRLRSPQNETAKSWWENVERLQQQAPGDGVFPDPPTGPSFSSFLGSSNTNPGNIPSWTVQKYEACLAAAKVVNNSLFFVVKVSQLRGVPTDMRLLASGLCRLVDATRAMSDRIRKVNELTRGHRFQGWQGQGGVDTEVLVLEKSYIIQIGGEFIQSTERLLMLIHDYILKLKAKKENLGEQNSMTALAGYVLAALQHTRLDTLDVFEDFESSLGNEFVRKTSKAIHDETKEIIKGK